MYFSRIISEASYFFLLCNPFWKLKGEMKFKNGIFV